MRNSFLEKNQLALFMEAIPNYRVIKDFASSEDKTEVVNTSSYNVGIITPEAIRAEQELGNIKDIIDTIINLAPAKMTSTQRSQYYQWHDEIRDRNAVLDSSINYIISNITNLDWKILYNKNDALSNEAGVLAETVIYNVLGNNGGLNFTGVMKFLCQALYKGFSVVECNYDSYQVENNTYVIPVQAYDRSQNNFRFNNKNELRWVTKLNGDTSKGEEIPIEKFILHQHSPTDDNPYGISICGAAVFWAVYLQLKCMEMWNNYCQRFSQPTPIGKYERGTDQKNKENLFNNLTALWKKRGAIISKEEEIQLLEASGQGINVLKEYMDWLGSSIATKILGQSNTVSSDGGGSYARDQVSYKVSGDIIKSYCKELEGTINNWLRFWLLLNFPDMTDNYIPEFQFNLETKQDIVQYMQATSTAVDLGVPIGVNNIYELLGISPPEENEQVLVKSQAAPSFPQMPFSEGSFQKKNTKSFAESLENIIEFSEKQVRTDIEDIDNSLTPTSIKKIAPLYTSVINDVVKHLSSAKTQNEAYKPDISTLNKIEDNILDYVFYLYNFGFYRAKTDYNLKMSWNPKGKLNLFSEQNYKNAEILRQIEFMPFDQAIDFFISKNPELYNNMDRTIQQFKDLAFYMSRATSYQAVLKVYGLLDKALNSGIGFKAWVDQNQATLDRLGFNTQSPFYLETVYRTNLATAYNAGAYDQMTQPAVEGYLTIWKYSGIGDARQSAICRALDDKMYAANDPIWDTIYPPNHFNCRSTVIALSKEMAKALFGTTKLETELPSVKIDGVKKFIEPEAGFQYNPAKNWVEQRAQFKEAPPSGWGGF